METLINNISAIEFLRQEKKAIEIDFLVYFNEDKVFVFNQENYDKLFIENVHLDLDW